MSVAIIKEPVYVLGNQLESKIAQIKTMSYNTIGEFGLFLRI